MSKLRDLRPIRHSSMHTRRMRFCPCQLFRVFLTALGLHCGERSLVHEHKGVTVVETPTKRFSRINTQTPMLYQARRVLRRNVLHPIRGIEAV